MTITATAPSTSPSAGVLVVSRLRAASAGVREAQAAVVLANDHLAAEIGEARRAGLSWAEICTTTNLNRHEAMGLLSAKQGTEPEPVPSEETADGALLMSVQEYAKHAGISEMTVYKRVREGRLIYTLNASGRKRIIVAASAKDSSDAEVAGGAAE